jgi:hypothetical protein
VVEAATIRQERYIMDAYFRLGELQRADPAAALESFRTALAAAQSFASEHPGVTPVYGLAQAAESVGDLAGGEALDRYRESLTQLDLALDKTGPDFRAAYLRVARKLAMAQFHSGDRLAALATLSPALTLAENAFAREASDQTRREVAGCNLYVGEVLARNGEDAAAEPKLRKALDLYRDLTNAKITANQNTPTAYESALAQVAATVQSDIGREIEAALAEFH